MTRFIHDKFAKDYLEELLKDYGEVKTSEKVSGEIKEIDVLFTPAKQQRGASQLCSKYKCLETSERIKGKIAKK